MRVALKNPAKWPIHVPLTQCWWLKSTPMARYVDDPRDECRHENQTAQHEGCMQQDEMGCMDQDEVAETRPMGKTRGCMEQDEMRCMEQDDPGRLLLLVQGMQHMTHEWNKVPHARQH